MNFIFKYSLYWQGSSMYMYFVILYEEDKAPGQTKIIQHEYLILRMNVNE